MPDAPASPAQARLIEAMDAFITCAQTALDHRSEYDRGNGVNVITAWIASDKLPTLLPALREAAWASLPPKPIGGAEPESWTHTMLGEAANLAAILGRVVEDGERGRVRLDEARLKEGRERIARLRERLESVKSFGAFPAADPVPTPVEAEPPPSPETGAGVEPVSPKTIPRKSEFRIAGPNIVIQTAGRTDEELKTELERAAEENPDAAVFLEWNHDDPRIRNIEPIRHPWDVPAEMPSDPDALANFVRAGMEPAPGLLFDAAGKLRHPRVRYDWNCSRTPLRVAWVCMRRLQAQGFGRVADIPPSPDFDGIDTIEAAHAAALAVLAWCERFTAAQAKPEAVRPEAVARIDERADRAKPEAVADRTRRKRRNRRPARAKSVVPTDKQTEAMRLFAECDGNVSKAARMAGVTPKTFRERIKAVERKLGTKLAAAANSRRVDGKTVHAGSGQRKAQLSTDRRGQTNVETDVPRLTVDTMRRTNTSTD